MRPPRPFGRLPLIAASFASIATLAWLGWHWTDIHRGAAYRSAAPDAASVQAGARKPPAAANARTGRPALAAPKAEAPGDARRRAPDSEASDGARLVHAPSAATVHPGAGGMTVALDPETGQLGAPSPEQMRALELAGQDLAVSRAEEGLRETVLANGTVILHLDGRFQDYLVARVDRNGRLVHGCAHDVHGLAAALRDTTAQGGLEVE